MAQTRTIFLASYLASSLFNGLSATAQIPPAFDAGALMRQNEQAIRAHQQQQAISKRVLLPPAAVLNETTVVKPERFKFIGNQRLSTEQLLAVSVPFANRTLNQHDLLYLTDAIAQEYRKAGWLVRVYIPHQDLDKPELAVQIIESTPPIKP